MAVVQGLTHYSMFVIGKTIKKYSVDVLKTLDFVSPIYKIMIASVSRYI
jgi:prephenate dehydrogenase